MYKLASKTESGFKALKNRFEEYIFGEGIKNLENTKIYAETVLKLFTKHFQIVQNVFYNDSQFYRAVEIGTSRYLNSNGNSIFNDLTLLDFFKNPAFKSAELLAKYSNTILKPKESSDSKQLSTLVSIFKLLHEQDVFIKYYALLLSKRLIYNVFDHEQEMNMIGKLKQVCSYSQIYKVQRMFSDVELAKELNNQFQIHDAKKLNIEMSGLVITYGSWPSVAPQPKVVFPQELAMALDCFSSFYETRFTGRKLIWLHTLSRFSVKTKYPLPQNRSYELQVSHDQLMILLKLNDEDSIEVETDADIQAFTKIGLLKVEHGKLTINDEFKSNKRKRKE